MSFIFYRLSPLISSPGTEKLLILQLSCSINSWKSLHNWVYVCIKSLQMALNCQKAPIAASYWIHFLTPLRIFLQSYKPDFYLGRGSVCIQQLKNLRSHWTSILASYYMSQDQIYQDISLHRACCLNEQNSRHSAMKSS